jgi:archaellum component FlaG (FlaF/FlaG flagellin family)
MRLKNLFCPVLISFLFLFPSLGCKKNPIIPNAEELTRPVIWLDTSELSFVAYESGGNPAAQVLRIKNSGKNALSYSISDDADWLSVEPANGSSTGQLVEHSILINKAGLVARDDDYEATITIVCSEAYNNPQRLSVSLKISKEPPPEIWVSPLEMKFAVKVGKNPSAQTLRVKNIGKGTLTYEITWDVPWLNVAPSGGSSGGEEKTHTVSADSKNLAKGSYDGTITVTSGSASNSPKHITISLEVSDNPPNPPPSTDNKISISCKPSSGGTGTIVSIPVSISGNLSSLSSFGLDLEYDNSLFEYQSTGQANLTGDWALVDGNIISPGKVTVGGFSGSGSTIPIGSVGTIAVVTLRVTGTGYSDGHISQITIKSYADDISGMRPDPATTSFTYQQ